MADIATTPGTQVAVQKKGFSQLLESPAIKQRIEEVLGERKTQFITSALSLFNSNQQLQNCDPASIFNACLTATSLGMPINNNLGFAYIIPYGKEAQFQIGYKGFKRLAINSNQYKELGAKPVFDGQLIEDNTFNGFHFDWKLKKSDNVIGYVSYFKIQNDFESYYYMSVDDVQKHAKKYSQTYKKGFGNWKDDFEKMAIKTVVKLHLNNGTAPLSIEMQRALDTDQSVIKNYNSQGKETLDIEVEYVDNTEEKIPNVKEVNNFKARENISKWIADSKTIEELEKCKKSIPNDDLDLYTEFEDKKRELSK